MSKKKLATLLLSLMTFACALLGIGCEDLLACDHEWKEATCTTAKTCTACGVVEGAPLDHDWQEATCAKPESCSRCDATKGETLPHTWVEATCIKAKYCSVCQTTEGEPLPHDFDESWGYKGADGHAHICKAEGCNALSEVTAHSGGSATCTELAKCAICQMSYGQLAEHDLVELENEAADCTTAGHRTVKCNDCTYTNTENFDALGHTWVDATCTVAKYCSVCSTTEGNPLSHNFNDDTWEYTEADGHAHTCKNAGCNYRGEITAHTSSGPATADTPETCTVCGYVITPVLTHVTHTPENAWSKDEAHHWKECTGCEDQELESGEHVYTDDCDVSCNTCGWIRAVTHDYAKTAHSANEHWTVCARCGAEEIGSRKSHVGGSATCLVQAKCAECGESYGKLAGHTTTVSEEVVATCTSAGYRIIVCTVDGCTYSTRENSAARGHDWDSALTCTTGRTCQRAGCNTAEPAKGHNLKSEVTSVLSCTTDAVTAYSCTDCDYGYTTTTAHHTGHTVASWTHDRDEAPVTRSAECTVVSVFKGICTTCTQEVEKEEEQVLHKEVATINNPATCSEAGEMLYTCSVCANTRTASYADENAHEWNEGVDKGNGVVLYTCKHDAEHTKTAISAKLETTANVNNSTLQEVGKVELANASMELDSTVLEGIPEDEQVNLTADIVDKSELSANFSDVLEKVGDKPIYNFALTTGTGEEQQPVEFNDGKVTVSVPYTLEEGEDPECIVVWYIDGTGAVTQYKATYTHGEPHGYATFEADHFSYYTVTRLSPLERCALYGCSFENIVYPVTCVSDGYTVRTCTRCGKTEKINVVKAVGHVFKATRTEATCLVDGQIVYDCDNCDYSYTEVIPSIGHTWGKPVVVDSTCTEVGSKTYTCTVNGCGASYTTVVALKQHEYTDTVIGATCTTTGYTTHTCGKCGHKYTDEHRLPKGHIYETSIIEPTCTADGYTLRECVNCDDSYQTDTVEKHHTWDIETPTCTGQSCIYCGANGLPATQEHQYVGNICSVCGEGCEHENATTSVVEPTCTDEGYTRLVCPDCSTERKSNFVNATGHVGDSVCSECGESLLSDDFFLESVESILHGEFTIRLTDCEIASSEQLNQVVSINFAELYLSVTEDYQLSGYGYGKADVMIHEKVEKVEIRAILEGDKCYLMALNMPSGGNGEENYNTGAFTQEYSTMNGYAIMPTNTMFMEMFEEDISIDDTVAMIAMMVNWLRDEILPIANNVLIVNKAVLGENGRNILEEMFEIEKIVGGYNVELDFDKLLAINEKLATKTISQLFHETDTSVYNAFKDEVLGLLDLTVGDLVNKVEGAGLSVDQVLAALNQLAQTMTGGECKTIEQFLYAMEIVPDADFNIKEFIQNPDFAGTTVGTLLVGAIGEEGVTVADLRKELAGMLGYLGEEYFYDLIATLSQQMGGNRDEVTPPSTNVSSSASASASMSVAPYTTEEEGLTGEAIAGYVEEILTMLRGMVRFGYVTDLNGAIEEISFGLNDFMPAEDVSLNFDIAFVNGYQTSLDYVGTIERIETIVQSAQMQKDAFDALVAQITPLQGAKPVYDEDGKLLSFSHDGMFIRIGIDHNVERGEDYYVNEELWAKYKISVDMSTALISVVEDCGSWVLVNYEPMVTRQLLGYETRRVKFVYGEEEGTKLDSVYEAKTEPAETVGFSEIWQGEWFPNYDRYGEYYSLEYFYNTNSGAVVGNTALGEYRETMHDFVLDSEVEAVGCSDIGERWYVCKSCDGQKVEYYCNGHSQLRYEYEFMSESRKCSDGVLVRSYCGVCSSLVKEEERKYCQEDVVKSFDFDKYDACGHEIAYRSCPCGNYCGLRAYGFNSESIEEDGVYVGTKYTCDECTLNYTMKSTSTSIDACHSEIAEEYHFYSENKLLDSYTHTFTDEHHKSVGYTPISLQGATCEDGVLVGDKCMNCGEVEDTYVVHYHAKGDKYLYADGKDKVSIYTCLCGAETSDKVDIEGEYVTRTDNDLQLIIFSKDGYTIAYSYNEALEGCMRVRRLTLKYDYDPLTGSYERTESIVVGKYEEHEFKRTGEFIKDTTSCEYGVLITLTCQRCKHTESYETNEHEFLTETVLNDADYDRTCPGQIVISTCLCGENSTVNFPANACDFDGVETTFNYEGVVYNNQSFSFHDRVFYNEMYKYRCAVTESECGFSYLGGVRYYNVGCRVYEERIVAVGEGANQRVYVQTMLYGTYHNVQSSFVPSDPSKPCYGMMLMTCLSCQEKLGEYYTSNHNWVEEEISPCHYALTCSQCGTKEGISISHNYAYKSETLKAPTCSQFGERSYRSYCSNCEETFDEGTEMIQPTKHDWVDFCDENGKVLYYVCSVCGLQNKNGADGVVVLEDLTEESNPDVYKVGYWIQSKEEEFIYSVNLIFEGDAEDVYVSNLTIDNDGVSVLSFSKSEVVAWATAHGYEAGSYDIRLSFVPMSGDGSNLDYGITFADIQ